MEVKNDKYSLEAIGDYVKVTCLEDGRTKIVKVVNDTSYKWSYKIQKTQIKAERGWKGFREHILWTMGKDSCWSHWGDAQFGNSIIINN